MAVVSQQKQYITMRAGKARRKAAFAGILYLLGTIGLAVVAFLGVFAPAEGEEVQWTLTNFYQPFVTVVQGIKENPADFLNVLIKNFVELFIAIIYAVMLLVCVINVLRSFAKLDNLFMKGNRKIGYNQSAVAMDKMAKIFSATFAAIAVISWTIRLFTFESWNFMFLITSGAFVLIHVLSGLVGGTVSRFASGDGFEEMPRKRGSFSPFLRNIFQLCAVGGLVYFIDKAHVYNRGLFYWILELLDFQYVGEMLSLGWEGISLSIVIPALALLIFIFTVVMLRHAVNPSEYNVNGTKGKATVRVASVFILLSAIAIVLLMFFQTTGENFFEFVTAKGVLEFLYIAAIALAMFIIECIMGKFPLLKKKYRTETAKPVDEDDTDEGTEETDETAEGSAESAPVTFNAPVLDYITAPGVYMQPNGTPVMIMPMVETQAAPKATPKQTVAAVQTPVQTVTPVTVATPKKPLTEQEKYVQSLKEKWISRAYMGAPEQKKSTAQPVTAEIYGQVTPETTGTDDGSGEQLSTKTE